MKLKDIKVTYIHPAMIENIKPETAYEVFKVQDGFEVNKVKFNTEELKCFFAPSNYTWDEVEFDEEVKKKTKN